MQSATKPASDKPTAPDRGLQFLIEPEPWLRVFARNVGDLFRAAPPPVWVTAKPAPYLPDALVHRPVAWRSERQSLLAHVLAVLVLYALHLLWLDQPQILPQAPPRTAGLHYPLSEYLPAVSTRKPEPPRRLRPQKADPEYSVQEIVVTNEHHISTRQTIIHPNPIFLKQDVPMPNLIVAAGIPGAPLAANHPLQILPATVPQIAEPASAVIPSRMRPLLFPPAAQPTVVAPAGSIATNRRAQPLPLEGPVVVPPAPETATRNLQALQLAAQAPEIAPPPSSIAAAHSLSTSSLPMAEAQVAPPAPGAAARNLGSLGIPSSDPTVAPPVQPASSGGSVREKELGQLLALNARPLDPVEPVNIPEGNRPGEFAASPEGHPGATARPEIKAGNNATPDHAVADPGAIYVAPPPARITSNSALAGPATPRPARALTPDKTDGRPNDRIDSQVFGTRRHYSMRLSMPNLSSSAGSWTVRFAELNPSGVAGADLSAPEAITKVDPAYPQDLMHDRVEGVVVLYAVIHSDGSVGEVRVLEGVDERLNENARIALQKWRFRPGTKDGVPIDIEAVVRVPFRVARSSF
ncbi:MAG TPA: TonB family protein [Candidatus Angelobacter sp.]|nr:TonB family protein [Candidatus Angelobacter sp.]